MELSKLPADISYEFMILGLVLASIRILFASVDLSTTLTIM
jgi:hypothetical protein